MRFAHETGPVRIADRAWFRLALNGMMLGLLLARPAEAAPSESPETVPAPVATVASTAPGDLNDLSAWLRYKVTSRRAALPEEARLFYRRGLLAWKSGDRDAAVRWVRGASELDPTFSAPHTTLLSWFAFRDPGQALLEAAALLQFARESFVFQLWLVANGLYVVVQSIFLGLLLAGLLILVNRNSELRHGWQERLTGFLTARAAKKWPWVFLAVPFLIGLGITWPVVVLLALLWPSLKAAERALFVGLLSAVIAAPLATPRLSHLAIPLGREGAPFNGVIGLESQPYSAELRQRFARLTEQHPDDRLLRFAHAWTTRQTDDFAAAEAAYRRSLEIASDDDRALNNLGNVQALQGRLEDAAESYRNATQANPKNAAAFFNLSQVQTLRFDYQAANEALAHGSALNFDLIRRGQEQAKQEGQMVLIDQWIAPRVFWEILLRQPEPANPAATLPPSWRNHIEFTGWPFSVVTLVSALIALVTGVLLNRKNPLRRCTNCERVVCRRCAERRRELALCRSCASTDARAEAADFARVLLEEHRKKLQRPGRLIRTTLAAMIPGYGLIAFRCVATPVVLLSLMAGLVTVALSAGPPYAYEPRFDLTSRSGLGLVGLALAILIYAISVLGYFAELSRADGRAAGSLKSLRSRGATKRRVTSAAA